MNVSRRLERLGFSETLFDLAMNVRGLDTVLGFLRGCVEWIDENCNCSVEIWDGLYGGRCQGASALQRFVIAKDIFFKVCFQNARAGYKNRSTPNTVFSSNTTRTRKKQ